MAQRIGRPDRHHISPRRLAAALVATSLTTTGCQGMAMTASDSKPPRTVEAHDTVADWPLRFHQHNFGIACYAVQKCSIFYSNLWHNRDARPAREDVHPNALNATSAGHVGILNFPEPALVRWSSRDGTPFEVEVDIGDIFRDRLIRHQTPREDIKEGVSILNPDVLLEVNDRTINVYMRAFLPTKELQIPGNKYSGHRDDLVLAWSRTY